MNIKCAAALAALLAATPALADTFTDAGGTVSQGQVDVSRTGNASLQCTLMVTATAATLATLWSGASGCPTLPTGSGKNGPQALYLQPTGGAINYRTDGQTLTASNGIEVFQNGGWWIEGRLSIAAMQLISVGGASVSVNAEVRW